MRKRGKLIKHKAAAAPCVMNQVILPGYEIQLQMALQAFRFGHAEPSHYLSLEDAMDMMRVAIELFPQQRPDPSTQAATEAALIALQNIYERYTDTGKLGCSSAELQVLHLLVETSRDYWSRRSGALYIAAFEQLEKVRAWQKKQQEKAA
ncbi:MAG: hypothetical protein RBR77_04345 [Thauera sp.]|jgi:hypothetical protein|nr:hypothetical protein [Thauera sp.]